MSIPTIGGTGITLEDLTMPYLFWPNPRKLEDDRLKNRDCWKFQVANPGDDGRFRQMLVWIDRQTGALLQSVGYDERSHPT